MAALTTPAKGRITQPYGRQSSGKFHWGTDRGRGSGRSVYAMRAGQVVAVQTLPDYGQIILLDHGRDAAGNSIQTRYCHLSKQEATYGAWVAAGELIGVMGSTGSLTSQVHLHSELIVNGQRVDETTYETPAIGFPKGEITMLGYNYNVPGKGFNTKVLKDPMTFTVVYPGATEQSAFLQSGGTFINLDAGMWSEIVAPCRKVETFAPPTIGTAPIDYAALAKAVNDDAARRLAS